MAAFFSPFFEATLPGMVATNPLDLLQTKVGIISLNVNDTWDTSVARLFIENCRKDHLESNRSKLNTDLIGNSPVILRGGAF